VLHFAFHRDMGVLNDEVGPQARLKPFPAVLSFLSSLTFSHLIFINPFQMTSQSLQNPDCITGGDPDACSVGVL
jgi:hypothetical protein